MVYDNEDGTDYSEDLLSDESSESELTQEEQLQSEYQRLLAEQQSKQRTRSLRRNIRRVKHPTATRVGRGAVDTVLGFVSGVKDYTGRTMEQRAQRRVETVSRVNDVGAHARSVVGQQRSSLDVLYGDRLQQGLSPDSFISSNNVDLLSTGSNNNQLLISGGNPGLSLLPTAKFQRRRTRGRKVQQTNSGVSLNII